MAPRPIPFFWISNEEGKLEYAFLGFFKARVGVFVISCQGVTFMLITTLVNMYARNDEEMGVQAIQYSLLALYLSIMYSAFILAFLAAYWELSKYIKIAAYLICAGMVFYIVLIILSMIPDYKIMRNTCPGLRCPDHHWLYRDRWRTILIDVDNSTEYPETSTTIEYDKSTEYPETSTTIEYEDSKNNPTQLYFEALFDDGNYTDVGDKNIFENSSQEEEKPIEQEYKRRSSIMFIIVSVAFILAYLFYLLYTALTFLSFGKQLDNA